MAPRQLSGSFSTTASAPRSTPRRLSTAEYSPKNTELPPTPEHEISPAMTPISSLPALESEVDLESETDLPIMTPPRTKQVPQWPRNASPSSSTLSTSPHNNITIPPMQRAHSSPGVDSNGRIITPTHTYYPRRPPSPLNSGRRRSPLRSTFEESYPASSWSGLNIEPNIPEHAELDLSTPVTPENEFGSISAIPTYTSISNTFPRSRRRPASPLHQSASAPSLNVSARVANHNVAGSTSPSLSSISAFSAARYANEPYPTYVYSLSSASSMPSTPTSFRSRSPSISSLETIEDTPDAEEAARLEDDVMRQRSGDEGEFVPETKRKSLDLKSAGLRSNKDRKRWSVCGAERRADFSLEVIEE